jgi:hypothetical protein
MDLTYIARMTPGRAASHPSGEGRPVAPEHLAREVISSGFVSPLMWLWFRDRPKLKSAPQQRNIASLRWHL